MSPTAQEWLNLAFRWAHVIAAIMWIGDSFLFMWLDRSLETPRRPREGDVQGEVWLTHGGGFYEMVKRRSLRPDELPPRLHWFKWESYSTWITGFFLLTVVYYFGGQATLVPVGGPLSHGAAVALSIGLLAAAVVVYHLLCLTPLVRAPWALGLLGLGAIAGLAYGLSGAFTARAAYLQVGAMLATIMSSNVLLRIIPAQRRMLAATRAGTKVDTSYGVRAKLHSTHNHYLTLPVVLLMLSNHFPTVYGGRAAWAAMVMLVLVGVGVKVFMNQRGETSPLLLAGTVASLGLAVFLSLPAPAVSPQGLAQQAEPVPFDRVHQIVQARCVTCHADNPSDPSFAAPPVGVVLERPDEIVAHQDRILARAVLTETMPLGNLTGMTAQERAELGAWIAQGAQVTAGGGSPAPAPAPPAPVASPAPAADAGPGAAPVATAPPPVELLPAPAPVPAATVDPAKEAAEVYRVRCQMCHGTSGAGDGLAAAALTPKPRAFSDPQWQRSVKDAYLRQVIVQGGASVGKSANMPANPDLARRPEVVDALVKHLRAFKR